MFEMLLEKLWLGPTRHLWGENQCRSLGANEFRDDLAACKKACENMESCNAIVVKDARFRISCSLIACTFPVPAPEYLPNDILLKGYYRATGKKANIYLEHYLIKKSLQLLIAFYIQLFVEND